MTLDVSGSFVQHDFHERLAFSEGVWVDQTMLAKLVMSTAAGISIRRASPNEDRHGTDYWIDRAHGLPPISVDVKHRSFCPIQKFGTDDACIETCSVYDGEAFGQYDDALRRKIGWTLDTRKRTDLVCYTWPTVGGGVRFWMLYFPHLCRAAQLNWRQWAAEYGERAARNDGYLTLSVYPPRKVIAAAMREIATGMTTAA